MEQWNPFADVGKSFAQGVQSAQGFAELQLKNDQLKAETEMKKRTLEQARAQHEFEIGKWTLDRMDKIIAQPAGPGQNGLIKATMNTMKQFGYQDTTVLESYLKDPQGVADMRAALAFINDLPPQQAFELIRLAPKHLTDAEVAETVKNVAAQRGELAKQKQAKDLEARNKTQEANVVKPEEWKQLASEARESTTKFKDQRMAFGGIHALVKDDKDQVNIQSMTGAQQQAFMKAFNRLNDSPAFHASDQAFQESLAGFFAQAANAIKKYDPKNPAPKLLPDAVMRDMYNAARKLERSAAAMELSAVTPIMNRATARGVEHNQILEPEQIELLNRNSGPVQDLDFNGKPMRPGQAQAAPSAPVVPPAPREPKTLSSGERARLKALVRGWKKQGLTTPEQLKAKSPLLTPEVLKSIGELK